MPSTAVYRAMTTAKPPPLPMSEKNAARWVERLMPPVPVALVRMAAIAAYSGNCTRMPAVAGTAFVTACRKFRGVPCRTRPRMRNTSR
ncbi:hypothetical protein SRABI128_06009 [Microbacterium sp. Bi128]|nr:hypothetical protein SRABI128_06009 [Microbacterium sp. Bi128]